MSNEDSRVSHVRIVAQRPPTQSSQPIGYNPEQWQQKIDAITYYPELQNNINGINADILPKGRINGLLFNKSLSVVNAIQSNVHIWDDLPALENLPIANDPTSVSPQYVSIPVRANSYLNIAQALRNVPNNLPGSYGVPAKTARPLYSVQQVPTNQVGSVNAQEASGSNFFMWVVNMLKGQ